MSYPTNTWHKFEILVLNKFVSEGDIRDVAIFQILDTFFLEGFFFHAIVCSYGDNFGITPMDVWRKRCMEEHLVDEFVQFHCAAAWSILSSSNAAVFQWFNSLNASIMLENCSCRWFSPAQIAKCSELKPWDVRRLVSGEKWYSRGCISTCEFKFITYSTTHPNTALNQEQIRIYTYAHVAPVPPSIAAVHIFELRHLVVVLFIFLDK